MWDGSRLHGLNASGPAPQAWTPEYFRRKHGADSRTPPMRGIDAVTIPGAVRGWAALSERFGALPFGDLLAPAIDIAERGYLVPPVVQQKWAAAAPLLGSQAGFASTFLPWGRAPNVGELFRFPAVARALQRIAETRGDAFYEGDIAQALVAFAKQEGGVLELSDLAAYRPEWVAPISRRYRDYTLHEIPPNGQGIAALIALGILEKFDLGALPLDSVRSQHLQIEAIKLAFADVYRYVSDPASMRVTPAQMLDDDYLAARARLIAVDRAQDFGAGNPVRGGTIYLTVADERGMMVSLIQSNYMGFGSGCVEPTFGISLQNRGHGFSLDAASPNVVAPGKRPFHTIIPGFLMRGGEPAMSFGVMGGHMQPQGHVQTLVRMLDYAQGPQDGLRRAALAFQRRSLAERGADHAVGHCAGPGRAGAPDRGVGGRLSGLRRGPVHLAAGRPGGRRLRRRQRSAPRRPRRRVLTCPRERPTSRSNAARPRMAKGAWKIPAR